MIALARLADVVIQQREHQQLRRVHFAEDRREPRVVEQALDVPHRQQRVLVDGVLVIEIARHPAGNLVQLGKYRSQQAAVAHLAEPGRETRTRPHELQDSTLMLGRRVEHLGRVVVLLLLALDQRERIVGDRHVARHGGLERAQPFGRRRHRGRAASANVMPSTTHIRFSPISRMGVGAGGSAARRTRPSARVTLRASLKIVGHQRFDSPAHVAA